MSEPGFREIQLSTKQVVFLFIAGVAAFVAVFLLGVSVGRGVTADRAQTEAGASTDPAADIKSTGVMPPPTSLKADELKYYDELQGRGAKPAASAPPTLPDAPPDPTPTASATPTPATPPIAKPAASPKPTPTPPPAPEKAAAPAGAGFFVQVDSFGSRDNAVRQVSQLKDRGISAYIFDAGGPGVRYKVRVGPFVDRAAADAMAARLRKEGFRPSVSR